MQRSETDPWTAELRDLWRRIARHDFENGQPLDFTRRFARHAGWSIGTTRAVIQEYRRFCFLAAAASDPVTPSEEVDEVWHFHLTYTADYWNVWCRAVLGKALHHHPTRGDPEEDAGFRIHYASTLARYECFFGTPPPAFWPCTQVRFGARARFRTIDAQRWIAVPRLIWRGAGQAK